MQASDLRQELITALTASTGKPRAFWDAIITRIAVHSPLPGELSNWSVRTTCGHRNAPAIRRPMNDAIEALRNEYPIVEPIAHNLAYRYEGALQSSKFHQGKAKSANMDRTLNIIERAYEIAGSGRCVYLRDIHRQLRREGYSGVARHLSGLSIKRELQALIKASHHTGVAIDQ